MYIRLKQQHNVGNELLLFKYCYSIYFVKHWTENIGYKIFNTTRFSPIINRYRAIIDKLKVLHTPDVNNIPLSGRCLKNKLLFIVISCVYFIMHFVFLNIPPLKVVKL